MKNVQIENTTVDEFLALMLKKEENAFKLGYLAAHSELQSKNNAKQFGETLDGVKELRDYLVYKGYLPKSRSLSYIEKVAPQFIEKGAAEKKPNGRLLFHVFFIDKLFAAGFAFTSSNKLPKKQVKKAA